MSREPKSSITHVSDTALWVATYRALERQRANAAFDDPLAESLAGERGRAIAGTFSRQELTAWSMVIRTSAIDRLIYDGLSSGIDAVLNLGAGLDARPYRLDLPQTLRWIEVDFPSIVELKNTKLVDHQPVCRVERIGIDLLHRPSRQALLARVGTESKRILVITEGLISYLSVSDASLLASDLHAVSSMQGWIQDFDNSGKPVLPRGWAKSLESAPFLFAVKDWFEFFEKYGWQSCKKVTSFEESSRINRPYPLDFPLWPSNEGNTQGMAPKYFELERRSLDGKGKQGEERRPSSSIGLRASTVPERRAFTTIPRRRPSQQPADSFKNLATG